MHGYLSFLLLPVNEVGYNNFLRDTGGQHQTRLVYFPNTFHMQVYEHKSFYYRSFLVEKGLHIHLEEHQTTNASSLYLERSRTDLVSR